MAVDYSKYQKLVLKYSYNGVSWANVKPEQYRKGEIIEANSYDCGYIEPIYRWVDVPGEYYCLNYSKYHKQRQQISGDDGQTWEWVIPFNEQAGSLIEADSYDCDYGVTWEPVENEYICERAFYESNYCIASCPDDNIKLISYVQEEYSSIVPDVIPGYSSSNEIHNYQLGVSMRGDGYLFTWNPDTGEVYWDGFLTNNNTWLSLARERNNAYSWTSSTSYSNTNGSLIGDWIYKRYTVSSTTDEKYLYVIYKVNIKTGVIDVLIDKITDYPLYDTNNVVVPGTSITPFYRLGNVLITDNKQYYFSESGTHYAIVTADLYSNNVVVKDLGVGSNWPGAGYYNIYSHNNLFPYTYYIFEDAYEYYSTTSGKDFGKIYKVNLLSESIEDFGLWICDLSSINANCGTNYNSRTGIVLNNATRYVYHRLNIDTPFMCMVSPSTQIVHKETIIISDSAYTIQTYDEDNGFLEVCNLFNPVYQFEVDNNTKIRRKLKYS